MITQVRDTSECRNSCLVSYPEPRVACSRKLCLFKRSTGGCILLYSVNGTEYARSDEYGGNTCMQYGVSTVEQS